MTMLHYDEYGSKDNPTILLLHGAGALDTFSQQYCFAGQYHLVVPHLPGAGQAADEIYEPEAAVQALLALAGHLDQQKIGVIGHSLGAQLAIRLVCARPEKFRFAVFLSAWAAPNPKTVRRYCALAGVAAKLLHWKWLVRLQGRYWNYSAEQADTMAAYSGRITPRGYRAFFANTLELSKLPAYPAVRLPMLAICGSRETRGVKASLAMLAQNPCCRTVILRGANHDFPMRSAARCNPILEEFILENC